MRPRERHRALGDPPLVFPQRGEVVVVPAELRGEWRTEGVWGVLGSEGCGVSWLVVGG